MHEIGMYHPRIHFPSDSWIKVAALYWTRMGRIVPPGYVTHDTDTVRALRDELGFVLDIDPQRTRPTNAGACTTFLSFVDDYHPWLRRQYGLAETGNLGRVAPQVSDRDSYEPWDGPHRVAQISNFKVALQLRGVLVQNDLAIDGGESLLMHPDLARVYMSALAEDVAVGNRLQPITDDRDVYAVGAGWTRRRMRSLLLPSYEPDGDADAAELEEDYREYGVDRSNISEMIGMIAIKAVVPRDIDRIPVGRIIELRQRFGPQFLAFRDVVDSLAVEIEENVRSVQDSTVFRAYVEQLAQGRILEPARQLRDEMHRLKIDTATTTLTFKYELPTLAGLAAGGLFAQQPAIAGGTAVAAGILGIARGARHHATEARHRSPVSYLMLLQDELDPGPVLKRAMRQVQKLTRSR